MPSQLLQNRPDIRQAERELVAAGLDVKVARVNFYPQLVLNGGVGLESFNMRYLFEPTCRGWQYRWWPGRAVDQHQSDQGRVPHRERQAIADHLQLPARDPQRLHRGYQPRDHGGELQHRASRSRSSSWKRSRPQSKPPTGFFRMPATDYIDVLFAQRDLWDARTVLIETKKEQLSAIVNTYQALGGGWDRTPPPLPVLPEQHILARAHATPPPPPGDPANPNAPVIDPNAPPTVPAQPPDLPAALP